MYSSSSESGIIEQNYKLVSDELIELLEIFLIIPINFVVSTVGILTNIFNVVVLVKIGFKGSMSLGTMALALTDLMVTSLQLVSEICYVLHYAIADSWIDFQALSTFNIGWLRYAGIYISGWVTTFIAMERCFCVVFPFHVKLICTRFIYVLVLMIIYSVYLALVLPVYVMQGMVWLPVTGTDFNNSQTVRQVLTVKFNEEAAKLETLFDSIGVVGLGFLSQGLLLVFTGVMVRSLKASSQIRTSISAATKSSGASPCKSPLSFREKKLIKVAVCLAVIMTLCNIPRYMVIAAFNTVPDIQDTDNLLLSVFMYDASDIFANLNCLCNFFVYMKINRTFRECFDGLFKL